MGGQILGGVLPSPAPRREQAVCFVLVVGDVFPKEGKLELGHAVLINSPSQSSHPGVQGQSKLSP